MGYKYLGKINSPKELEQLNIAELETLCEEARSEILRVVSKNGGHLASNLGAVELTAAADRVFCGEDDDIIFDVGHQCYTHKLLTGRFDAFETLRKENGIAGFMRPNESRYDPVITGHSSASISAAFGISKAKLLSGSGGSTVAVIGDGALTGGMSYEALNSLGKDKAKVIIILNDNSMSISKNVGSLSRHLRMIRVTPSYHKLKKGTERFLDKIPLIGHVLYRIMAKLKRGFKKIFYSHNIFESLGFDYFGPVDGHDLEKLDEAFRIAKELDNSCVVHVITKKGKGYTPAEQNPSIYHGVPPFDLETGAAATGINFSKKFGEKLCELAEKDEKICAVTAAMTDGTGLTEFSKKFPTRCFDAGIAEQHAITFSAGLAKGGYKPVAAIYSSFLQRGYDQILHDAAIARLPVTICVDRAGFVGEDGETHQGLYDVAMLSSIPGVKILAPSNYADLDFMLEQRLNAPEGVAAIRYPRGGEPKMPEWYSPSGQEFDVFGKGHTAVVTYGVTVSAALEAFAKLQNEGKNCAVVKLNVVSPLGDKLINELIRYKTIHIFEEGEKQGGAAEHLTALLSQAGFKGAVTITAAEGFVPQSTVQSARERFCLTQEAIYNKISGARE